MLILWQVYLPISLDDENWYLFKICMLTLQIHVFFPYDCQPNTCFQNSSCIHCDVHRIEVEFESFFICFLQRISYFRNSNQQPIDELPVSGYSVWPHNGGHIGRDSGVVICMLLRMLVQNRSLDCQEINIQGASMRYRRFMADELYALRTL
jgi:hypothetical protein